MPSCNFPSITGATALALVGCTHITDDARVGAAVNAAPAQVVSVPFVGPDGTSVELRDAAGPGSVVDLVVHARTDFALRCGSEWASVNAGLADTTVKSLIVEGHAVNCRGTFDGVDAEVFLFVEQREGEEKLRLSFSFAWCHSTGGELEPDPACAVVDTILGFVYTAASFTAATPATLPFRLRNHGNVARVLVGQRIRHATEGAFVAKATIVDFRVDHVESVTFRSKDAREQAVAGGQLQTEANSMGLSLLGRPADPTSGMATPDVIVNRILERPEFRP